MKYNRFYYKPDVSSLWFKNLSSNSWQELAILCAIVAAVCLVKYLLDTALFVLIKYPQWRQRSTYIVIRVLHHVLGTIVTVLHASLGYILMLAFMSYNVWICVTIVVASALFFYLTAWSHSYIYQQISLPAQAEGAMALSAGSYSSAANESKSVDIAKDNRKSVEAEQLLSMSTFQRNQMLQSEEPEVEASADATTLLIRPDLLAQESDDGAQYKSRSGSDPLLDKYPVLRFHNVDVKDTSPVPNRRSRALGMDELDELIKELGEV